MNILDSVLSLIAPHTCVSCGAESSVLCYSCMITMPNTPSICYACGKATRDNMPCRKHAGRHKPTRVYIFTGYEDVAKDVMHQFKFEYKRAAAMDIAKSMDLVLPHYPAPPLITCVPSTGSHVRERGFDGTALIAKGLAKIRSYKFRPLLIKLNSSQQKGANRKERLAQLKGAFGAVNKDIIKGADILLVDDVVTTGATIEECTRTLMANGARSVEVVVFARTPL